MNECIVFEDGEKPYKLPVDPKSFCVYFGYDEQGLPISHRIGIYSQTSPGKEVKYLYATNYIGGMPSYSEIEEAITDLKPKPYNG